jgi:glyoxylate reductase
VTRKKVYVTRKIPGPCVSILSKECEVTLHKRADPPSRRETLKNIAGKDGLLCMLSDKIDAELLDAAGPNLKVISSYSTGYEHIDVKAATERGIRVTFTADILAEATADLAFALLLACARNVVKGDTFVREGRWKVGWMPDLMLGKNVHGSTLGIIGLGRIGSAVARRARGFGMKVIYNNRSRNVEAENESGASFVELDDLFRQSDFVSVHTSLNGSSRHMINLAKLELMKKTAFLVNTSRGPVINEADLARALKREMIAGAGLDVFEKEPLPRTSPLVRMKNVVLLPHVGSASVETRSQMGLVAAESLMAVLNGREPDRKFVVN